MCVLTSDIYGSLYTVIFWDQYNQMPHDLVYYSCNISGYNIYYRCGHFLHIDNIQPLSVKIKEDVKMVTLTG
jgi:hypothetical protein